VYAFRGETTNFTSFLRVSCLRYMALKADASIDGREAWRRVVEATETADTVQHEKASEVQRMP